MAKKIGILTLSTDYWLDFLLFSFLIMGVLKKQTYSENSFYYRLRYLISLTILYTGLMSIDINFRNYVFGIINAVKDHYTVQLTSINNNFIALRNFINIA